MSKYTIGTKSVKMGDFNPTDGTITNLVEIPVYKGTVQITEDPPTKTKHYKEGSSMPIKIGLSAGAEMCQFSVPDISADMLEMLNEGSTVTTVNSKKKWNKKKGTPSELIAALQVETLDGYIYTIVRGSWTVSRSMALSDTGIALSLVVVEATDTGLPLVSDVSWTEA